MSLFNDVRFDSLGAVREEIRLWLGPGAISPSVTPRDAAARDALVAVLIHSLAQELSDIRVRSHIQALLADMTRSAGEPFAD